MGKKGRIILITVAAAVVLVVAAVLIWVFPLRSMWTKELSEYFSSPENAERYVCDMTYSAKKSGADGPTVSEYTVVRNARSDGVWKYVADDRYGQYMYGDTCYEYNGDPLAGGKLNETCDGANAPMPSYMEYFAFLFGGEDAPDLGGAAKRVNKFVWGDAITYTFAIAPEWFIENKLYGLRIYDAWYYDYGDLRFKVVKDGRSDAVTQIECSYDYSVEAHMSVDVNPNIPGMTNVDFIAPYSYDIDICATFSYPEQDTPIETDAQLDLVLDLNAGRAEKSRTSYSERYLSPVESDCPSVGYVYPDDIDGESGSACTLFPSEDILAVYEDEHLEIYRASTLEKLCSMEYYLGVLSVDADNGRLLVTLESGPLYPNDLGYLPWEENVCYVVYDLSDFSVVHTYKPDGKISYTPGNHFLYDDRIIHCGRLSTITLHDISTGETLETEYYAREIYMDAENGKVIYEYDLQEYRTYDIATGEVSDADGWMPTYNDTTELNIGDHTLKYDYSNSSITLVNQLDGSTEMTFDYVYTGSGCKKNAVARMSDGKYFCALKGCLFVLDLSGQRNNA